MQGLLGQVLIHSIFHSFIHSFFHSFILSFLQVERVLRLYSRKFGLPGDGRLQASNFVLKVCGRQEYLLGDEPLSNFKYIRKMCDKQLKPGLVLVDEATVLGE